MFSNLLRKKLFIEEKVKKLQLKYLEQLKVYNDDIKDDAAKNSSLERVKNTLGVKQEELDSINETYKAFFNEIKIGLNLINEAQNSALDINSTLSQFCTSLGIIFPEDLEACVSSSIKQLAATNENDDESNKENSVVSNKEEL